MKHQKLFAAILTVSTIVSSMSSLDTRAEEITFYKNTARSAAYSNAADWVIDEDGTTLLEYTGEDAAEIIVPEQITAIGAHCFSYHDELTHVILPTKLTAIGESAFQGCENLMEINLPRSLAQLGNSVFEGCSSLEEIEIPPGIYPFPNAVFANCKNLKKAVFQKGASDSGTATFENCISLTEVSLPSTILYIGSETFRECKSLTSIKLPKKCDSIMSRAFQNCTSLTTVEIAYDDDEVPFNILSQAFAGCINLKDINLPDNTNVVEVTGMVKEVSAFWGCDKFVEEHTIDGNFIISNVLVLGNVTEPVYHVPDGIVSIAASALEGQEMLAVECSDSVRYIGRKAMAECPNLIDVKLNDGCKALYLEVFSQSRSLRSLVIPASVTQIGTQNSSCIIDIYGTPGTEAETFARTKTVGYQIAFHDVAEMYDGIDKTFDYAKDGWSFGNSGTVFGGSYYLNATDRQALADSGISVENIEGVWSGSCAGLSVTAILAKNGIFTPEQFRHGAKTLSDLQGTPDVLSFINYFQCIGGRNGISSSYTKDIQKLYNAQKIAKNVPNGASPFLLVIPTASSSHAVVGYGHEAGTWKYAGKSYDARILIWDSNFPQAINEDACLYYDTRTFDYCIPYYGIHVAQGANDNSGELITVCNDLNILNAYPYPFDGHTPYEPVTGDLNLDGTVTVGDAVLLARLVAGDSTLQIAKTAIENADMNSDGMFTADDLTMILKKIVSAD